jgi:hypothetical protein
MMALHVGSNAIEWRERVTVKPRGGYYNGIHF